VAWQKIDDPDKSWELLHAGLLWFKNTDDTYEHYSAARACIWTNCRDAWATADGENFPNAKYVLLEE